MRLIHSLRRLWVRVSLGPSVLGPLCPGPFGGRRPLATRSLAPWCPGSRRGAAACGGLPSPHVSARRCAAGRFRLGGCGSGPRRSACLRGQRGGGGPSGRAVWGCGCALLGSLGELFCRTTVLYDRPVRPSRTTIIKMIIFDCFLQCFLQNKPLPKASVGRVGSTGWKYYCRRRPKLLSSLLSSGREIIVVIIVVEARNYCRSLLSSGLEIIVVIIVVGA